MAPACSETIHGRQTLLAKLRKMGIRNALHLAKYPTDLLVREFKSFGMTLHAFANGMDDSPVARQPQRYMK